MVLNYNGNKNWEIIAGKIIGYNNVLEVSANTITVNGDVAIEGGNITLGSVTQNGTIELCNNNYKVTIGTSDSTSANYTLTLPDDDGNPGQILETNGSGTLSWVDNEITTLTSVPYYIEIGIGVSGGAGIYSIADNVVATLNTLSTISTSISNYNSDLVNSTTWEPSVAGLFLINYKALIGSGDANYLVESTIQIEKETTEGWNVINNSKIRNWGSNVNVADARVFIMSHTLPFTIYAVVGDKFRFSFFGRSYNNNDICMLTSSVNSNITITKFNNVSTLVSVTDNEDEDNVITFVPGGDGSGNVGLEYDDNFKYNPSTGTLTVSNISGTLMTANQSNITSVGILNSVDIDGGTIDGTTIGANIASSGSFTTLSSSGNITGGSSSILSVAANTDTAHTLGRARIGHTGHNDWAAFSHINNATQNNYALVQGRNGLTNVNAKAGQPIQLCINNVPVLRVYSTDVYLVQPLKINNTKISSATTGTLTSTVFNNNEIAGTNGEVLKIDSYNQYGYYVALIVKGTTFLAHYNTSIILYATSFNTTSDDRLKHNETVIQNSLETIMKLSAENYDFGEEGAGDYVKSSGFIAQEVEQIPELKHAVNLPNTESKYYSLNYEIIFTYAVSAIQELNTIVTTQATTISTLEAKLATQEAKLNALEARLTSAGI
jgi:hypothetical protein